MNKSLELVGKKMKDADKSPLEVWKQALENITPQVEVKSKRIGGATHYDRGRLKRRCAGTLCWK